MSKPIELPEIPKDEDYEDYVCAHIQSSGMYVEKKIIYREVEELLELDIIISDFNSTRIDKFLTEVKSKKWGFSEIFKLKGWMVFLKFAKALFIVQETRPSQSWFRDVAQGLNVDLIDNSDLSNTYECLKKYCPVEPNPYDIESLRYSYLIERKALRKIKELKRSNKTIEGYKKLDDYWFKVNSASFFNTAVTRTSKLFRVFIEYKNLTAGICEELRVGKYPDEPVSGLSNNCFRDTFYSASDNIYQVSLLTEHLNRVTVLKCCIEQIINRDETSDDQFWDRLSYLNLPGTIKQGLEEIAQEEYFYRYPIFWQVFTYLMGGFILTDIQDKEYKLLSERTGIPLSHIDIAFDSFNKLFPRKDGWFQQLGNSNIKFHRLFPIPFRGVGANFRRLIYTNNGEYNDLKENLTGPMTFNDLIKWNNLAYEILK